MQQHCEFVFEEQCQEKHDDREAIVCENLRFQNAFSSHEQKSRRDLESVFEKIRFCDGTSGLTVELKFARRRSLTVSIETNNLIEFL